MTTLVNSELTCSCLGGSDTVTWTGVSGGAISLSPTGSPVLVATVPFTTGSLPVADGLWGLLWMSWAAKSATTGKFSIAERRFIGAVKGASSIGSYLYYNNANLDSSVIFLPNPNDGFVFDAPDSVSDYVQILGAVNGSGDLEISLNCLATDAHSGAGVAWDFTNLSAEYRIIGCE